MKTIYVTFAVSHLHHYDEKFAVKCENMDGAIEVARDAFSLHGVKNVRIRKCGKPRNREIMSYDNYWKSSNWY